MKWILVIRRNDGSVRHLDFFYRKGAVNFARFYRDRGASCKLIKPLKGA